MKRILRNGALAGLAGGGALALVLVLLGESSIEDAIRLERAAHPGEAADEMFSRGAQHVGGIIGALIYGVLLGLVFAVVFALVRHRLPARTDFRRSALVGLAGYVAVVAVPFVLYPANPPGVGDPDTITRRTVAFLVAMAWGLVTVVFTARLGRALRGRGLGEPAWVSASLLAFVALVAIAAAVLPGPAATTGIPADLLWRFRLTSLAGSATCWTVLALTFGAIPVEARAQRRQRELAGV